MNKTETTITTRDFGEIAVPNDDIISFPKGLFAFEKLKSFVLISPLGQDVYPMWLQCADSEEPCFIVYEPFEMVENYNPILDDECKSIIDFDEDDELSYLVIAVVPDEYKNTTVNLKSPIVINKNKAKAMQVILDEDYKIKFPIFQNKGDA